MNKYPERDPMFALHYVKWLSDSGAVKEVGPEAFSLLVAVVTKEDDTRYQRAVNFFNEQLADRCGIVSVHALIRARNKAVEAGLLFYEPAKKRRPGRYFVCGFHAQSAQEVEECLAQSAGKAEGKRKETATLHSYPNPIPKSNGASLFSGVSFDDFWKAYPPRNGRKVGKADAEKAFAKINPADHKPLMAAVNNLRTSGQMPKDAHRFLAKDWRDWTQPSEPTQEDTVFNQAKRRKALQ